MVGGAVGGAGRSLFMNLAFGAPYQSVTTYTDENGNKTLIPALHRNGGLLNMMLGGDVTLGRNATAYSPSSAKHESMHVKQQMERGWANFYGETIIQYFKAFVKYGDWTKVYDTPRTFEYEANTKFDNIMIK